MEARWNIDTVVLISVAPHVYVEGGKSELCHNLLSNPNPVACTLKMSEE